MSQMTSGFERIVSSSSRVVELCVCDEGRIERVLGIGSRVMRRDIIRDIRKSKVDVNKRFRKLELND